MKSLTEREENWLAGTCCISSGVLTMKDSTSKILLTKSIFRSDSVDKTKLSCITTLSSAFYTTHRHRTTISLETHAKFRRRTSAVAK